MIPAKSRFGERCGLDALGALSANGAIVIGQAE
jgi:hypothetical protein